MTVTKYRAKPTVIDGIRFASKAEARRYSELRLLQKAGKITGLVCQPKVDCKVNGQKVCTYVADFWYVKAGSDDEVYEDVKGVRTPIYKLKKKLVKALHDIDVQEIRA